MSDKDLTEIATRLQTVSAFGRLSLHEVEQALKRLPELGYIIVSATEPVTKR
jgi:hypothetical protein